MGGWEWSNETSEPSELFIPIRNLFVVQFRLAFRFLYEPIFQKYLFFYANAIYNRFLSFHITDSFTSITKFIHEIKKKGNQNIRKAIQNFSSFSSSWIHSIGFIGTFFILIWLSSKLSFWFSFEEKLICLNLFFSSYSEYFSSISLKFFLLVAILFSIHYGLFPSLNWFNLVWKITFTSPLPLDTHRPKRDGWSKLCNFFFSLSRCNSKIAFF